MLRPLIAFARRRHDYPFVTTLMRNQLASASSSLTPFAAPAADRRNKARLRELCDEVLASFRVASDRDLFSEQDRAEGRALLTRIAPLARA